MRIETIISAATPSGLSIGLACDRRSTCEVDVFIQTLERDHPNDHKKTMALFSRVAEHGIPVNREKVKQVDGPIQEFKLHQVRILWFRHLTDHRLLVCASAERKKGDFLKPGTIKRAKERYNELCSHLGIAP